MTAHLNDAAAQSSERPLGSNYPQTNHQRLARAGLIDEYQIVVIPIALGNGRTMFDGLQEKLNLRLTRARTFGNGNALLCYEPVA